MTHLMSWSMTRKLFQIRSRTDLIFSPKEALTSVLWRPIAYAVRAAKASHRKQVTPTNTCTYDYLQKYKYAPFGCDARSMKIATSVKP